MRIAIRFSARALCGGNHGIDRARSAERYGALLREAVTKDFGSAELAIEIADEERPSVQVVVTGADDSEAASAERAVLDLAWVVKQCAAWSVPV